MPSSRALLALVLLAALAGCVRREGRNTACEWPNERVAPLDLSNASQWRHLVADAQFAEELGIRHGDAFEGRETVDERGRRVEACTDRLLAWIVVLHSVSHDDLQRARAAREWRVDVVTVFSPILLIFWVVATAVTARLRRRFSASDRRATLVAIFVSSLVITTAAVFAGELWSWLVEIVRVGNSHLSYRSSRLPWVQHRVVIFATGVVLFWAIARWGSRRAAPTPGESVP